MKLCAEGIKNRRSWEEKGYSLPKFDREKVTADTKENPTWVHFGAGNIFRAFQANVAQNLLNEGVLDKGIIAVSGAETVNKMNRPQDDLNLLVTLKVDGTVEKIVVGSVVESVALESRGPVDPVEFDRLKEIFTKPSLQMGSFTITEKGYAIKSPDGNYFPNVVEDFTNGPANPNSYMAKVAALLYARYNAGAYPVSMVSMDNCSHNGDKLRDAVVTIAEKWLENGLVDADYVAYVSDRNKVAFPWSMIDKITPRPDESVEKMLKEDGIENIDPIITSKNTYIAPFVNAEETEYLVIEDCFPNGRPALEKGGVIFTDGETVDKVEKMKVCTCLNPLHTALAVYGCILGHTKISAELKDPELKKMVEIIGYKEGLPVVVNPGILDPKEFIDTVVNVRFPNPFMPDTPQRIATDTSQKLAIRFGETVKAYAASETLDVNDLKLIPLVFAGWLRYLMGVNDAGEAFELSPDPLLDMACPFVKDAKLGESFDTSTLRPLLENASIFGVNLYEVGLADKVCGYFNELIAGVGAIRATLKKYVNE